MLYASVLEFIHTATLVHDDIIDESQLRRGREAVHTRWGNHVTVLFGDFLYLKSMSLALTQDDLAIIRLLCDVTLRIVEGEIYQLTKNGDADLTEAEHFEIVQSKTAYLFAGCARIGGMLGPITREQQEALWQYGLNIGMAFQIVDDLLDFTGRRSCPRQACRRRSPRGQADTAGDSHAGSRRTARDGVAAQGRRGARSQPRGVARDSSTADADPLDRVRTAASHPTTSSAPRKRSTASPRPMRGTR